MTQESEVQLHFLVLIDVTFELCRFVFRLAEMDLGELGHAFALLRMPRMAEIKHAAVSLNSFTPSSVDPDTVKVHPLGGMHLLLSPPLLLHTGIDISLPHFLHHPHNI